MINDTKFDSRWACVGSPGTGFPAGLLKKIPNMDVCRKLGACPACRRSQFMPIQSGICTAALRPQRQRATLAYSSIRVAFSEDS